MKRIKSIYLLIVAAIRLPPHVVNCITGTIKSVEETRKDKERFFVDTQILAAKR